MTDRHSSDDELALVRAMWARPITRRWLLDRSARLGVLALVAPAAVACAVAATPSPTANPVSPGSGSSPTPVPTPESELFVYNYDAYIDETVVPEFEAKYGVKVIYDPFDTYDTMVAKIADGHSGYDVTFATSVDVPGFYANGLIQALDLSLIPNRVNLAPEWTDPEYDPGNLHSMPYMWWTTGVAYDSAKVQGELTSWAALWDPAYKGHLGVLDEYREAFGAALIRLGYSVNTTDDAELDAALELLREQAPLVRDYTTDDIGALASGDFWVVHAWGADVVQVVGDVPTVKYYLPEEGAIRGSDAMVLLTGAQHPVAAHLFINHMLDAKISAANTNAIGYMGPNAAAREFIDPAILDDPALNPDKAAIDKLQELLDLGPDLEKYRERWRKLGRA